LRPTCRPCPDSRCLTYPVVPISPLCWPPVRTSSSYFLLKTSYFFRTFLISWSFCNNQKCWGNSFLARRAVWLMTHLTGHFFFTFDTCPLGGSMPINISLINPPPERWHDD
jgi:hypothetical protein